MIRGLTTFLLIVAVLGLFSTDEARAQLSASNLMEAQSGNHPHFSQLDRTDLYNQLNLDWTFDPLRVGLRFEINENSGSPMSEPGYREFTQRYAEWTDPALRALIGNFYTILGRGLIHRSFELPGVVLEQVGIRSRYGPSRDVDGVLLESRRGPVEALLFGGRPNAGTYSPTGAEFGLERYQGQLAGGQLAARVWRDARLGAAYLRQTNDQGGRVGEFASGFLDADLLRLVGVGEASLPLYFEYALRSPSLDRWFRFDTGDEEASAMYVGTNLLWGPLALSAEWKDYSGFRSGLYNDPPSLVREHAFTLLNRNTHLLDADDEAGYQLEGSWTWADMGSITLNRSSAVGEPGPTTRLRFDEVYAELHAMPARIPWAELTAFIDFGQDDWIFIRDRDLYGGSATVRAYTHWSATADLQRQVAERAGAPEFDDLFLGFTVARAGWGSAAVLFERSTDPEQEDPEFNPIPGVTPRHFTAGVLSARLSERHDAVLFFGERRGGRACTAGTCYEVKPFTGVELRLTSRL
jgi:hypothetical protein